MRPGRLGGGGRTLVIWGTGLISATALVAVTVVSLQAPDAAAREQVQRAAPADLELRDTALAITQAQADFVAALQTQDAVSRGSLISEAQAFGQSANASWTTYKRYALHRPGEDALGQAYVQANGLGDTLGAKLVSLSRVVAGLRIDARRATHRLQRRR